MKYPLVFFVFVLVFGWSLSTKAQDSISIDAEKVYLEIDEKPIFPGCEDAPADEIVDCTEKNLLRYIYMNVVYPITARENGIEGLIVAEFVVETDGTITNIKILRDIGGGCGEEVVRVVESMNQMPVKWTPGRLDGESVRVRHLLPVRFKLTGNNRKAKRLKRRNNQ